MILTQYIPPYLKRTNDLKLQKNQKTLMQKQKVSASNKRKPLLSTVHVQAIASVLTLFGRIL